MPCQRALAGRFCAANPESREEALLLPAKWRAQRVGVVWSLRWPSA